MATAMTAKTTTADSLQSTDTGLEAQDSGIVEDFIKTEITYLVKDPKHESEKPYELKYDTEGTIPNTNMANEFRHVIIHDFRPLQNSQSFKDYGFSSVKVNCALTAAEFEDKKKVEAVYYPAIEKLLLQKYPNAAEVKILEHIFRKRDLHFPALKGKFVEYSQPATCVHTDFSLNSAALTACAAFKIIPNKYRRLLIVNFWKSLQGPGNDWPLALCDWRTIDYSSESIAADIVHHNRFTENERFYYSPKHEWYYFKDLREDEVVMLRQTDSDLERGGGVAHASFYNPMADENAAPRASIELRAFVFFE